MIRRRVPKCPRNACCTNLFDRQSRFEPGAAGASAAATITSGALGVGAEIVDHGPCRGERIAYAGVMAVVGDATSGEAALGGGVAGPLTSAVMDGAMMIPVPISC
jgi:hypothetical protein